MLNGREEIYANCMVVDKVDEGGIKYSVNDVTTGSTSTDHESYEIASEDHNDQACNSKFEETNLFASEDQECQQSIGECFEEKVDTTIHDEDQDHFVESISDLSSPENIYCRSLLPPRQHVSVKLESHSMNISHKQSFNFDGLDADSEGEEVSDRSQGSCTPRSPNSVAVFASSGDELDSSETLHESEMKTRGHDSTISIRNVPPKESEDTGIRLRSYSLSSPKGSQSKSRFARDFNVPDSTSEEQRAFSQTEHPKEKRYCETQRIEEEEWDKYIIPSKSETEKCKVSRTFSFLKSRMTSTRNKGKGKNKDKDTKEKEKWSNGHHFITGTLSGAMQCPFCDKVVAGKDMLQCFNCTLNVHKNCKDSLPMCTKKPQDRYQMISRNKPTHSLQSASIKEVSTSQSSFSSLNTSSSSLPVGISALKRESSLQPLSKSASSISIERRIMESMDVEMDPYTSRNRSQSEELLQTMGTSPSTEVSALEDNVVPSMRGDLESDAQEFKAESWSLTVDPTFCDKQEKDLIKRQDVIYELMQTEMHHIQILEIMSEIFRKGMKEDLQFDHSTIDRIFPCLDELLEIHKNFFFCLKERRRESFVEDSERNFFISRIGNILMQQFSDENANKMKQTYGDFCSHHNEAVSVFKELQQQNKKFQHFIRQQSNNLLVRRLGVPECILLVTQRITKYPVLLERILQYTKEGTEEHKDVTKSLSLIKDIIAAVDTKVNKYEKEQKLLDILNKFENKTCAKLKNGHTFRKQDLLSGERELLHDGSVYWKTATGRLKDITGLLLTDVLIFLQDKDQKYTFAAVDQKPAVISLQKLIVREVANEERGMFLISASSAGPEMYEIHTNSKEDRNTWMRLIRLAVESCPEEEVERLSESEEDKRIAEARAARTRKFQERLSCQDQQICTSLEEKLRIYGEMAEKNGCEEAAQDAHLLMKPETTELPQAGLLLNAAVKEAENLQMMLTSQSCGSARRSLEGLGEPVSPHKQEHFGSGSTRISPTVYASDTRTPSSLSPVTDSEGRSGSESSVMQSDSEVHRPGSDIGIQKIIHSVQNLTQLLYSLQAVVSIQDSCIEVQRLILQERERPPHNHGPRGSLLLEQEKQRNLEKQREELVNVRKLQHQLQQEQQRWELECEWRQREQEAQANRLQERERECQQQAEQLRKEQEDLQSQWKEYQQNSERLREGMKLVEKNKERVQLQQRQLNACKHERQRSLPVMMFPQENSQIPVHTRTGSLGGQGLDMSSVFVNEAALHYSLNSHQRNNNMRVFPEPPKVDGYLSSATRTDENQKHEVPVQLVSTTNQLLKPATVHQQIPARLASFSKTNREKNNKVSCDQLNYAKEVLSAKDILKEEDASKATGFTTRMLPEHPSLIVYPNMNSDEVAWFAHQPSTSILLLGPSQSQRETQLLEESSVPQEAKNGPKEGAEEEKEDDEENIIYF
eukprot:gi/632974167/ref/XP_007903523.1/ PREDICTED: rho guanine nucleotide exchange factor 28 [Callorhinchus milii]